LPEPAVEPVLRTARLSLRRFQAPDAAALAALNASPEVMRHVGPPLDAAENAALLERILTEDAAGGSGWFAVEQRADGVFVGAALLKRLSERNRTALGAAAGGRVAEQFEVGWRFLPAYWRRDYATESGRALVRRAFDELALPRLVAVALVANVGSCRVIEKLGLRPAYDFEVYAQPARMFVLTRARYEELYESERRPDESRQPEVP
jgi:RimJ/RimL family protein N-acetyltransferase